MPTVSDVLQALERIAPERWAFPFDHIGLQLGSPDSEVKKVAVSLDRSLAAVRFAKASGAQMLLAHHPLIWDPLTEITDRTHVGRTVAELLQSGIAFAAAHTNWDCAPGGVNDALASRLGLQQTQTFGASALVPRTIVLVDVPTQNAEAVIEAASKAGAGCLGAYSHCAFTVHGQGCFTPEPGSNPTIGSLGNPEKVDEAQVQMVLPSALRSPVDAAIRAAHPYEVPAIAFLEMDPWQEAPIGRIGILPNPTTLPAFARQIAKAFKTTITAWGADDAEISRVAVVGGAADEEWLAAQAAGAHVLVTGEVKQHVALEAAESGFCLVAAGHYATEQPGCQDLCARLDEQNLGVQFLLHMPEPGQAGRPLEFGW